MHAQTIRNPAGMRGGSNTEQPLMSLRRRAATIPIIQVTEYIRTQVSFAQNRPCPDCRVPRAGRRTLDLAKTTPFQPPAIQSRKGRKIVARNVPQAPGSPSLAGVLVLRVLGWRSVARAKDKCRVESEKNKHLAP